MKWRIQPRHFHDEIEGSAGLAPELQSRARANEFNPLHCVQDWRVMRFRKTKLLVLQGDAIFEHLRELAALRIQTAITEVDNWRLGLFADDNARRSGHHLSIIVTGEGRELFRFHERSFLAGIDSRPFHWRQRRIRHRIRVEQLPVTTITLSASAISVTLVIASDWFSFALAHGALFVFTLLPLLCERRRRDFSSLSSVVTIDIVTVAFRNRSREGVLTQAGLDKTTERDRRERGSQSKSEFRIHARDEKELSSAMQAFLLHFCNVCVRLAILSAHSRLIDVAVRQDCLPHQALDVRRQSRGNLAEADWAMKVNR